MAGPCVGQLRLEVGDSLVLEPQVGTCGCQSFVEGAAVAGELADALFERGVFGGDALDGFLGPFGFQVADAAEEFADVGEIGRASCRERV